MREIKSERETGLVPMYQLPIRLTILLILFYKAVCRFMCKLLILGKKKYVPLEANCIPMYRAGKKPINRERLRQCRCLRCSILTMHRCNSEMHAVV
jgi:hypothetical protein